MKIAQINMTYYGSTGKIMLDVAQCARADGHIVKTFSPKTYKRKQKKKYPQITDHIYFGTTLEAMIHVYAGMATGMNGLFSQFGTWQLIRELEKFQPDIVHIHNIHNFCINIPILFKYLKKRRIRTVFTLHDCWPFTGHCPYFQLTHCNKWKTGCHHCSQLSVYPKAYIDTTKFMWKYKKKLFSGLNMHIVTPSNWLASLVKQSYLKEYSVYVINNGIDLSVFHPIKSDFRETHGLADKKIILGVADGWAERKGFSDCLTLAQKIDKDYQIVLVGLTDSQIQKLPPNILGIAKTNSQKELVEIYSSADVFINTTYEDNYPTVNLEARACGLPVVTYATGGSPESAGKDAYVVEPGNIIALKEAAEKAICEKCGKYQIDNSISCQLMSRQYIKLYRTLLQQ